MNNRLYVENLPVTATESSVRELFARCGAVTDVKMVLDPATGRPRGRAFVTLATPELAAGALKTMSGFSFEGRHLVVNMARPIEDRPSGLIGHGFEADHSTDAGKAPERSGRPPRAPRPSGGRSHRHKSSSPKAAHARSGSVAPAGPRGPKRQGPRPPRAR